MQIKKKYLILANFWGFYGIYTKSCPVYVSGNNVRFFPKEASEAMTLALNADYERTKKFSGLIDISSNSPSKIDVN